MSGTKLKADLLFDQHLQMNSYPVHSFMFLWTRAVATMGLVHFWNLNLIYFIFLFSSQCSIKSVLFNL